MLSYKQKIRGSRSKVTMDNFDLYADLPPLVPVEDDIKPPVMSVTDIKTLQKYPYMAGVRRSSVATAGSSSSSSADSWLPKPSASPSDLPDRRMMESKSAVSFDLTPSKRSKDCVEVLPQNTVPMAKYRKNFIRKKQMKESAELEGTITDEEIWKRRKTQEEQARIAAVKKRQSASGKGGVVNEQEIGDGFDKIHEKRTLEEEIFRPTYVADADLDEESFFSAIGKSLPRRKIAVVSAVMQKIEKRRQEREERMLNEKIMAELHTIGSSGEKQSETVAQTPTKAQPDDEIKVTDQQQQEKIAKSPSNDQHIGENSNESQQNGNDDPNAHTNPLKHDPDTDNTDEAVEPETSIARKKSSNKPPRLHPVAKRPSFLQKLSHAKSEGNIMAALNPSPPDDFCDTGAMISYSEILMASAKHLEHTVSMIDISQPSNPLQSGAYVPQLSDYATARDERQNVFVLPPEIGEVDSESDVVDYGYDSPAVLAASLPSLNNRPMSAHPTGETSREPIYSKVRKNKSGPAQHARRQSTNSARRRMHRSHGSNLNYSGKHGARISRSASSGDVAMVERLASIVEKQNELMERWQDMEEARQGIVSRRSLRNSGSIYNSNRSFGDLEDEYTSESRRPSLAASFRSIDSVSDSGELQTQFDDLTYESMGPRDQHSRGSESAMNRPLPSPTSDPATIDASATKPDISKLAQKPIKPIRKSIVARSQVQTPNGHIYNEREIIRPPYPVATGDSPTQHSPFQPVEASTEPPKPNSQPDVTKSNKDPAQKIPVLRKKSTRREITKDTSQVITIDVINSWDKKLDSDDVISDRVPLLGNATTSRSNSSAGVRRRRSLIRVQGIRNQRGESVEQLNEKIQSVVDAGTGMDGASEGWWVMWSKRQVADSKADGKLVKRVASFFRKDDIEKRKEIDVVAELMQKLPGESIEDFTEAQWPSAQQVKAANSAAPVPTQSRRPSSTEEMSAPKKRLIPVPSNDEDVSDVGPLPADSRKPRRFFKQPSFDSGVSTNPTDDDAGDVSPKSRDVRVTSVPDVASQSASNKADSVATNLQQAKQVDADETSEQSDVTESKTEESFLTKVAAFFGVSLEGTSATSDGPKPISIFG